MSPTSYQIAPPRKRSPLARGRAFSRSGPTGRALRNVCEVGGLGYGRDGSYRDSMSEPVVENDPKGLGPAILAGVEVAKLPRSARESP